MSLMGMRVGRWDNRPVFERPANGIAALISLAAIVLSVARVLQDGFSLSAWAGVGLAVAMLVIGGWWLSRQAPGTPFHDMAIPAAVATIVPFLVGSGLNQLGYES